MSDVGGGDCEELDTETETPGPENPIFGYFTYNEDTEKSKCILGGCKHKKTMDEAGDTSLAGKLTGNLKRHLKRWHADAFKRFLKEEETYNKSLEELRKTKKVTGKRRNAKIADVRSIKRNLVRLVAVRGRPLALMDDPEFQELMEQNLQSLPKNERFKVNSTNVRALVEEEATRIRKAITEEMKGKLICAKVDSCTKGQRPFFAINAQFIDKGAVQIRTLTVKEMAVTQQLAENLKNEVKMTAMDYEVPPENIYTVTSEIGGNMILSAKLLGEDQESLMDVDMDFSQGGEDIMEGCQLAARDFKCQCVRCAAHSLQLAVEHGLKSCPGTLEILGEVRKLAVDMRRPNKRKELKLAGEPVPCLDNATRWSSKDDMCKSVLSLKTYLQSSEVEVEGGGNGVEGLEDDGGKSDALDWEAVENVVAALAPAKEATTRLQAEQLLLGDLLCTWNRCKEKLRKLNLPLAQRIANEMDLVSKRTTYKTGPYKNQEKWPSLFDYDAALAAVFMDPRFFTYLSEQEQHDAKAHLKKLWLRIQMAKKKVADPDEIESNADLPSSSGVSQNELCSEEESDDDFTAALRLGNDARRSTSAAESEISSLLEKYYAETPLLKRKDNVLKFWEQRKRTHPELAELASVALAVPATQVSVERLFSSLRFMLDPLRMRLTSAFVDDLLVIRNNTIMMEKSH